MTDIKGVEVNVSHESASYTVGKKVLFHPTRGDEIVTKITEYIYTSDEDHQYQVISIYTESGLVAEINNTPVSIYY